MGKISFTVFFFLTLFWTEQDALAEEGPLRFVRENILEIEKIKKDSALMAVEKQKRLEKKLNAFFDFDEIALRSLGKNIDLYRNQDGKLDKNVLAFLKRSSADRVGGYKLEKIEYKRQEIKDFNRATVHLEAYSSSWISFAAEFSLKKSGQSGWRVWDVVIGGSVSLIQYFREKFRKALLKRETNQIEEP